MTDGPSVSRLSISGTSVCATRLSLPRLADGCLRADVSETDDPQTDVAETEDPETDVAETEVPETEIPETDDPETDDPETDVAETDDSPETVGVLC